MSDKDVLLIDPTKEDLDLWSALVAHKQQHGPDATWAFVARVLPRKAANRPRHPDIEHRLQLTCELIESERRAGRLLTLAAAARRIDKQHNPHATENTFRSIVRAHKHLRAVQRLVYSMGAGKPDPKLSDDIFFGCAK